MPPRWRYCEPFDPEVLRADPYRRRLLQSMLFVIGMAVFAAVMAVDLIRDGRGRGWLFALAVPLASVGAAKMAWALWSTRNLPRRDPAGEG